MENVVELRLRWTAGGYIARHRQCKPAEKFSYLLYSST